MALPMPPRGHGSPLADDVTITDPIVGPAVAAEEPIPVRAPRLARHTVTLSDGHRIGLAVSGRGVPLVVVHGFTAEGFLYAQTLSRLVTKGFKVVAIDMAGHGGTQGLPTRGLDLAAYATLLGQAIDELGIRRALLAGHSMGGRVVAHLAADRPERTIAVLLVDAIVGDPWDLAVQLNRINPLFHGYMGAVLAADTVSTLPVFRDPIQAAKLLRLVTPTLIGHALQPWRLVGSMASIFRSSPSRGTLEDLAHHGVPTFVLHGDRDVAVPLCTGRSAAARTKGQLVTIEGGTHSWILKDPETFPAIVEELLDGALGHAVRQALGLAGAESVEEIEELLFEPGAPILAMTPDTASAPGSTADAPRHRRPRYAWRITDG